MRDRRTARPRSPVSSPAAVAALALAALLSAPGAAAAQGRVRLPSTEPVRPLAPSKEQRERARGDADVPPEHRPPAGMCRVWIDDVPPGQQPAPTDCAAAVRNRPANGRVLFGDDYVDEPVRPRVTKPTRERRPPSRFDLVPHGPMAAEASFDQEAAGEARGDATEAASAAPEQPPVAAADSARRAQRARRGAAEARRRARVARDVDAELDGDGDLDAGADRDAYESGYAAGYADARQGRPPRARGVVGAGAGTGVLVVPPGGDDPRYFNNGRFPPPGRANGTCLDRDGDGWCDDPRYGPPVCRDLDGDGRCDDYPALAAAAYPSALPSMQAGMDFQSGRGSDVALRWLGTAEVVARTSGGARGSTPYRVLWYDASSNDLLQTWTDRDRDGVADRVEIFRNGRRVKLLGR